MGFCEKCKKTLTYMDIGGAMLETGHSKTCGENDSVDENLLSQRVRPKEREKMEEKYSVTVYCKNCGKTRISQIICGLPWKEATKNDVCENCKVKRANWVLVNLS